MFLSPRDGSRRLLAFLAAALLFLPLLWCDPPPARSPAMALQDTPMPLSDAERQSLARLPWARAAFAPLEHPAVEERWRDIGGAAYADRLREAFRYDAARVTVVYRRLGETFAGRIEAAGLKPNFAYQIKLQGVYEVDPEAHRRIGLVGRWRLPGRRTNYDDRDYEAAADKSRIEAYLLFDFLVTDAAGAATHEFALRDSLHVLWSDRVNGSLRYANGAVREYPLRRDPGMAEVTVRVGAENEGVSRGRFAVGAARLPEGRYRCRVVLTEESFHDDYRDGGGYWATVLGAPVEFLVDRAAPVLLPAPAAERPVTAKPESLSLIHGVREIQ